MSEQRNGDWIQTFTGRAFWPLDPRPDEVEIRDIAHALSNQCRYAGHTSRFYSVAEHCVLLARAVSPKNRLWALLHDASEAYLVDLPRPVKRSMPDYRAAEEAVMLAVRRQFFLVDPMPAEVHLADGRILTDERQQAMETPPMPWTAEEQVEPLGVTLQFWTPAMAEIQFLAAFDRLFDPERYAARAGLPCAPVSPIAATGGTRHV
jgi:hypothetical protein